jgi:molybdopterin-guanine dinucleotide biosynthesis protein A
MGRDKSTLPHPNGGTFASHAIARLTGLCDHICVAGESSATVDADVLKDPALFRGPVVGIVTALTFASQNGYDACLVTPVDVPFLTAEDLAALCRAWQEDGTLCCAVSEDDDRLQPLVAIYPSSLETNLKQLAESENRSLIRWLQKQDLRRVRLSAQSCRNVNTPDDLAN